MINTDRSGRKILIEHNHVLSLEVDSVLTVLKALYIMT